LGATFESWRGFAPLFGVHAYVSSARLSSETLNRSLCLQRTWWEWHRCLLVIISRRFSILLSVLLSSTHSLSAATLPRVFFNIPCLQRRVLNVSVHHPRQDYFSQGSGASPTFRSSISISLSEVMPRFNTLQPRAGRLFPSSEGDELG
jgi:hypothetical protein